jgi:DNA-binding transcriptional MocR family regulator
MRCAISEGIADQVLVKLNKAYCSRSQKLCKGLRADPRIQITNPPLGGYFVWLQFPPETGSASEFLTYCEGQQVKFLPGVRCDPFHGVLDDNNGIETASGLAFDEFSLYARLCFADMDEATIEDGVAVFVKCFQQYLTVRSTERGPVKQPNLESD